jgi:hypothetical protein
MTRQFESLIPILNVSDFQTSTKHYAEKLGSRKVWEWGEPPTIVCVTRDGIEIFFCLAGQCQPGMWMSIFVNDVDGLYDELRERGAKIVMPHTTPPFKLIADLKKKHGLDYDTHANYRFTEE